MNERRTSWRHQICHIYMSFEKVGCCFGWPHLLADIRSLRFCPPQAKKVHLKHLICPPQAKILEVILTDVAILRQISSTIHQNTRTIPLRSRNNAITAIKLCSIRVWVASFFHILHVHRQRRASCDQYCRDTIDSPSTKHAVLTKLNDYNILMSDIDRNTIRMFQDRVCSRYQHVFTYRRRSLRQNRTLLIIKSRYLMDMSPLYHVVG